jgi:TRAP-type C4-dicarboxylate transport system permease small subunit
MRFCEIILIIMLGSAIIVVAMHVMLRYVMRSPISWAEQMARFALVWIVMLGIPVMFNRNIKISFDAILEAITGKARERLEIVLRAIGMAFSVFYFSAAIQLMIKTGDRMTPGIEMPYNLLYGAQAVCTFLLFFVLLKQIIERRGKSEEQGGDAK